MADVTKKINMSHPLAQNNEQYEGYTIFTLEFNKVLIKFMAYKDVVHIVKTKLEQVMSGNYTKCGEANQNGNVALSYLGGCKHKILKQDSYRCTGCGGWFHLDCILKHFELEESHDNARNALRKIKDYCGNTKIMHEYAHVLQIAKSGLKQNKPLKNI